jgi:site-specific recombinase XerD
MADRCVHLAFEHGFRCGEKPTLNLPRKGAHGNPRRRAPPWLFISERGQPLTRQSVNYLVAEAAARAGLPPMHPHRLRHSWGFSLANRG